MSYRAAETITVTRKGVPTGGYDSGGYPIVGADTTFPIVRVPIAPAGSTEDPQTLGLWVVTGFTLYLPYGTILLPTDRIEIRGIPGWQVVGDTTASGYLSPFSGKKAGAVVSVKRAS